MVLRAAAWVVCTVRMVPCDSRTAPSALVVKLEMIPTQQRERMVVDPVNQYQKLHLQLYELLMMGVNTRNM